jgi:glycerophosphoryl diester phosphodiesterase
LVVALTNKPTHAATAKAQDVIDESFDKPEGTLPSGWKPVSGHWRIAERGLLAESLHGEGLILCGDPTWQNYEIEVAATFLQVANDARWLSVVVRAGPDGARPWSHFVMRQKTTAANGTEFAVLLDRGWAVRKRSAAVADSRLGRPRKLRVVVRGTTIWGYVDGRLVIESPFCVDRSTGRVGLAVNGCVARFESFRVSRLPDEPVPPKPEARPCEVVAHRGFSFQAPENTLAAVREAIRAGAEGCEFDVYRCKDGEIVLMHDKMVDRTTNGHGDITQLTLAELKRLDAGSWKDAAYAGQRVPTLREALETLKGSGCRAVIEIKMEGISEEVIEAVRSTGMLDQATVIAFSDKVVREIRQREPKLPCAWLCGKKLEGTSAQRAAWIAEKAQQCGTNLVDLLYEMVSPEIVAELHRRGIGVWVWTVDEPEIMTILSSWGVDSITTNRPDAARQRLPRDTGR